MYGSPSILLLGAKNILSEQLAFVLTQKGCKVFFATARTLGDLEKEIGLENLNKISFIIFTASTLFSLNPKIRQLDSDIEREKLTFDLTKKIKTKALLIYPYTERQELQQSTQKRVDALLQELKNTISVVYLGDLFEAVLKNTPPVYPVSISKVSGMIIKILFSINYYNFKTALLGKQVKINGLKKDSRKVFQTKAKVDEIQFFDCKKEFKNHFTNLQNTSLTTSNEFKILKTLRSFLQNKIVLSVLVFTIVSSPISILANVFILNNLSQRFFEKGEITISGYYIKVSSKLLKIAGPLSKTTPFLNEPYIFLLKQNEVLGKLNTVANNLYKTFSGTWDETSGGVYSEITLDLQTVYTGMGQIQNLLNSQNPILKFIIGPSLNFEKLVNFKIQIAELTALSRNLPKIFGEKDVKNYLITQENPKTLMPGGGGIQKITMVSFSKGKVIAKTNIDMDFSKNTFLESDFAPKIYNTLLLKDLGLRSVNTHPDFQVTANKMLFLVEKQQDFKADGVISLNTKELENLKKPKNANDFYKILYSVLLELKNNNIQVYLSNESAKKLLTNLGFSGIVQKPECINECYADIVKYFELSKDDGSGVRREINLEVNLEEKVVKRKMTVFLENTSGETYKSYLNVLVPDDAGFAPPLFLETEVAGQDDTSLFAFNGFKVLTVYFEILPHISKTVIFSWESGADLGPKSLNEYVLTIVRQGGMSDFKINTNIKTGNAFTLTQVGNLMYNATLLEDKTLRVYFK